MISNIDFYNDGSIIKGSNFEWIVIINRKVQGNEFRDIDKLLSLDLGYVTNAQR